MPNIAKKLVRANAPTSETALYTTPASTTAVVTNIVVSNTTAAAVAITIKLAGTEVLAGTSVSANGILALDLKQVINATETIQVTAGAAGLRVHISGMEVS